ncbi:uncharacterized protein LOC126778057 [Nymphalis io]|uniref:uncharacterized protein LOC126778057 n=1 Tax=Inachis io TaxID=171585 RepID=UPI002166E942|nr:uncharacterized protein LOC126778057 [Nymphalis io]
MNNNPINRIYTYLFENNWFKVKLLKDRKEAVVKITNTSELEERVKEDKSYKPKKEKIATPRSKLIRSFHLNTCEKKTDKPEIVYKGDNELKITKKFGDPVSVNDNNNDEEVNASGVTVSTISLSYDTKSYTNTTVDYQESPKCVQAVARKRKVSGDSKDGSESTQRQIVAARNVELVAGLRFLIVNKKKTTNITIVMDHESPWILDDE